MPKSGGPEPGLAAIGAVILAAGSGRRIGTPKLRLEAAGRSYLELILDQLGEAEIAPVVCVVSADQAEWAGHHLAAASRLGNPRPEETPGRHQKVVSSPPPHLRPKGVPGRQHGAVASRFSDPQLEGTPGRPFTAEWSLLINPHPELGMFSSVQLGVAALRECQGLFIVPVDHPFVALPTYLLLKQAFQHHPDAVIKPAFDARPGHPIVLPQEALAQLLAAAADATLQQVLRQSGIRQILVESADAGVLRNINQKGDIEE